MQSVALTSSCGLPGFITEWPASGTMRRSASGQALAVLREILDHLGLPSEPPILARSRVGEELVRPVSKGAR